MPNKRGECIVEQFDLVSIIIPVYKVEKYIKRCVDSVINQTYSNLEIILVDDGSPDNCGQICDDYLQKDNRIKVIHKKNGGLSDARNVGILQAKGTYISFLDSDDYIDSNFIKELYELCVINESDIAFCHIYRGNKRIKTIFSKDSDYNVYSSKELLDKWHSIFTHIETVAWGKLYHRSLFQLDDASPLLYETGRLHEDVLMTHKLVYNASRIVITNKAFYHYTINPDSITNKTFSCKRFIDTNYSLEERTAFFKSKGFDKAYHRLLIFTLKGWILGISKIKKWNIDCPNEVLRVNKCFSKRYDEAISFSEIRLYEKILFYTFKKVPSICTNILINIYLILQSYK